MRDSFLVFGISGQVPGEEAFLVMERGDDEKRND
jgi:hypothetical protein